MSDLIAIAYPDHQTAQAVRRRLADLMSHRAIDLEDAVVVTRFLAPLIGAAVGAAGAAAGAAFTDVGINEQFMKRLGRTLTPGGAALILLVRTITPEEVLPHLRRYGGEVIQTSLDAETEACLRAALRVRASAPGT